MLPSLHVRTSVVSSSTAKIYRQGLQRSWCRSGPSPTRGSIPSSSSPPPGSLPTWPQAQIWLCCSCSSLSVCLFISLVLLPSLSFSTAVEEESMLFLFLLPVIRRQCSALFVWSCSTLLVWSASGANANCSLMLSCTTLLCLHLFPISLP